MTATISYAEGGLDRTSPTRNAVSICERDDDTDEETFHTEDPVVIAQLWEWADAQPTTT